MGSDYTQLRFNDRKFGSDVNFFYSDS